MSCSGYSLISSGNVFNCKRRYFVWDQVATSLFKVIRKHTKQLHTSLLWFFFLLILNNLVSISSLAKPICHSKILHKDLFQVCIWEINAALMLYQFLFLPIWSTHVRNVFWKNSIYAFSKICITKLAFWVLRFVQSCCERTEPHCASLL